MPHPIPISIQHAVVEMLQHREGSVVSIQNFSFSNGGSINQAGKLTTSAGDFFLKWNDAQLFPGMFDAEARGLALLRHPGLIAIPDVIGTDNTGSYQFLLLEYIRQTPYAEGFWQKLGQQLAALHHLTANAFGLDHDNYMGSLKQFNEGNASWINFFIEKRLHIQLTLARNSQHIDTTEVKRLEAFYKLLPALLPTENPALLHGDLWIGNLLAANNGDPCLIDPAVYFGNREVDMAMTKLFGGFHAEFYTSYQEAFPMLPGYEKRFDIYNLYPLLVHVNLFGKSYWGQINSILNNYL